MGTKNFTVDARTILQLGRDSIKSHTTALSELIKNSYDADANEVVVEVMRNPNELDKSYIRIADDGFGMTEEIIDDNWLRIGFSNKKKTKVSARGRRKTGEKGIGRIAADRLGSILKLKTISLEGKPEGLIVDWNKFDVDNLALSDVDIEIMENPTPTLPNNSIQGTEIIIENLRQDWTEANILQLKAELSTLVSPFQQKSDFTIDLRTNIFKGEKRKLKIDSSFLDAAEVTLEVEYDGQQDFLNYYIEDKKYDVSKLEQVKISQLLSELQNETPDGKIPIGPFSIKLLFFTRDVVALKRSNFHKIGEFRKALDEFQGIKIYRDGIAVKPYGFRDSTFGDWLELADRKAQNPAGVSRKDYRLTPNQLVGAVFISRDNNSKLRDSAAREGLVENDEYNLLKDITLRSIQVLEGHRHQMAVDPNNVIDEGGKIHRKPKKSKAGKLESISNNLSNIGKEIKTISSNVKLSNLDPNNRISKSLDEAAEEIIRDKEKLTNVGEELLNENRVLGGLATLGISSAVFGHEIQSAVSLLNQATINVKGLLKRSVLKDQEKIEKEVNKAIKYSDMISSWGSFSLSRVSLEKRRSPKKHKIHG